jgi:hypothetical protein
MTTGKAIDRFFVLSGTLLLACRQYDVPSKVFWTQVLSGRSWLALVVITMIGVFGTLTPFESYASRRVVGRRTALRSQILVHFGRILGLVRKIKPQLEMEDLGLHVWRVRRSLRHPFRPRLTRLATYRLGTAPATRSFNPREGVGVVGLCWESNAEASMDVEVLATTIASEQNFVAYRNKHGQDAVMGLTWQEFNKVKHRGAVFASPIRKGRSKFIGCVSVDAARGFTTLNTTALWREINELCSILANDGFEHV